MSAQELGDEILEDLNELGGSGSGDEEDNAEANGDANNSQMNVDNTVKMDEDVEDGEQEKLLEVPEGGTKPAEELRAEDIEHSDLTKVQDPAEVATLSSSKSFQDTLAKINEYVQLSPQDISHPESPEYKLIVQANSLSVEVDNEILIVHKYTRDHFAPRFSELESLVMTSPLDYSRTVKAIGNTQDLDKLNLSAELKNVLPEATIMVVTMTATTSTGRKLTDQEWAMVEKACSMIEDLHSAKQNITAYIESRISALAPNLSTIVGTKTATKLLSISGGLVGLSKMSGDNIYLLGAQKKTPIGLSTGSHSTARKHTGFIYDSEIVQSMEPEFRRKAQRTVGAKCILAVRMDSAGVSKDGSYGKKLLEDVEKKLDALAAPPPSKVTKALPVPKENTKKRRGGRRARKAKEAYAQTELGKLQNRVRFGEAENEDLAFDQSKGLGMIGSSSGRLRAGGGDERTKAKMSKSNKNRLSTLRAGGSGSSGTASGISSSLAFTPVQGMELVDPRMKKAQEANEKWFAGGTFSFVGQKGESTLPGTKKDTGEKK